MRCPRDKAGLIRFASSNSASHTCPDCHGVWLPNEALRQSFASHGLEGTELNGLIKARLECEPSPNRHCTVCPQTRLLMCRIAGIELDFCPKCSGLWLDKGELTALKKWHAEQTSDARKPVAGTEAGDSSWVGSGFEVLGSIAEALLYIW